jgi:hypothetical protein
MTQNYEFAKRVVEIGWKGSDRKGIEKLGKKFLRDRFPEFLSCKTVSVGLKQALESGRLMSEFEADAVRLLLKMYARNGQALHHSDSDGEFFFE